MVKNLIKKFTRRFGYDITQYPNIPPDTPDADRQTIKLVSPFSKTSPERIYSLIQATRYITQQNIIGDFVECGVWKGGSMMAAAKTLTILGITNRQLYLFDTFEGMPPPSEKDVAYTGYSAKKILQNSKKSDMGSFWCYAPLEMVRKNMESTQYPMKNITFVKGKVESTIPEKSPDSISLLRLDTDWYESTKHEMIHLFPRLTKGGVLIIDDYGHWKGVREAVDDYLVENKIRIHLVRIDYTGAIGIKI